jgi:uracil-DNA glycosylase
MDPMGNLDGKVLVIWGTVSEMEDREGCMVDGDEMITLKRTLKQNGYDLDECAFVRAVRCHCEKPSDKQILSCSEHHYKLIKEGNFTNLLLIGKAAVTSYFSYQDNKYATYAKLRGLTIPDTTFNMFISVISPPSPPDGVRYESDIIQTTLFINDIKQAAAYYGKRPPEAFSRIREYIFPCDDEQAIVEMKKVLNGKFKTFIAFDYETTGLSPHNSGHRILSVGIATAKRHCFSFMLTPKTRPWLKKLLRSRHVPKVAANIKFEKTWSKIILEATVNNWMFDTMLGAHVIDNRPGITSVKFQAFALFGFYGYEKAVARYIKASTSDTKAHGTNAFNQMDKLADDVMLEYVGLDALLEYWIAIKQLEII